MLDRPDVDVSIDVNLATLAERLPKTVHLHDDVKLISGNFKARCVGQAKEGQVVWQGRINAADIRGIRGTQALAWNDPVAVDIQLRNLHQAVPTIDRLKCSSRFLNIEANQAANRFTLTAEADLQQLAEPLSQFVDLAGIQVAGKANATIQVQRFDDERFVVNGEGKIAFIGHPATPEFQAEVEKLSKIKAEKKSDASSDKKSDHSSESKSDKKTNKKN